MNANSYLRCGYDEYGSFLPYTNSYERAWLSGFRLPGASTRNQRRLLRFSAFSAGMSVLVVL